MLLCPVTDIKTTTLDASSAVVAASPDVLGRLRRGRHGIAISAIDSDIYLGDKDVSSGGGMLIPSGTTSETLPVSMMSVDTLYVVGGSCVLTEFF